MTVAEQTLTREAASPARRMAIEYEMIGPTVVTLDCLFLVALAPLATAIFSWPAAIPGDGYWRSAAVSAVFCALIVPLFSVRGLYDPTALADFSRQLRTIVSVCALIFGLLIIVASQFEMSPNSSRCAEANFISVLMLLTLHHMWWSRRLHQGAKGVGIRPSEIALVTVDGRVEPEQRLRLEALGYDIRILVSVAEFGRGADRRVKTATALRGAAIDEVVLAVPYECVGAALIRDLTATPFPVRFLPDNRLADIVGHPIRSNGSAILFDVRSGPLNDRERRVKRLLDIAASILGLLLLSPLFALVAAAIVLETSGPALFQQTRLGFNGVPFKIYKFRSMKVTEDGPNVIAAKRGDARVTGVGRFIRRFSIDELPQLINVLRGEMSLVGPRPHALAHDEIYDRTVADYANRQHVKPGLTGWAQINGHRGEIRNPTEMAQRLQYDLWYIRNWRISLDLKIILSTAFAVFFSSKAY